MTVLRRMMSELRASPERPSTPLTDETLASLFGGGPTDAGVTVTEKSALSLGAVWRAVTLISAVGAALPLHAYTDGTHNRLARKVIRDPHPEMTRHEFWQLGYGHRLLWGNQFAQKFYTRGGELAELHPVRPEKVTPLRLKPSAASPSGKWFLVRGDDGVERRLTTREIFHVPGFGYDGVAGLSPVQAARQAIALGIAAERYGAKLFGSGALMAGILKTKQRLKQGDADRLRARWRDATAGLDNQHQIPVLDSDAAFEPLTMPNDDAQFLETRHFQVVDVARWFGVPPFLLMETEKSTSWGTGLEQQAQGFVTWDLHPQYLSPTEQRITKELLGENEVAKYSLEGLLRGDSKARAEFYRTLRELGVLNADEIRELENRPPLPDGLGQGYLQPLNFGPLGTKPTADQASTTPDEGES